MGAKQETQKKKKEKEIQIKREEERDKELCSNTNMTRANSAKQQLNQVMLLFLFNPQKIIWNILSGKFLLTKVGWCGNQKQITVNKPQRCFTLNKQWNISGHLWDTNRLTAWRGNYFNDTATNWLTCFMTSCWTNNTPHHSVMLSWYFSVTPARCYNVNIHYILFFMFSFIFHFFLH